MKMYAVLTRVSTYVCVPDSIMVIIQKVCGGRGRGHDPVCEWRVEQRAVCEIKITEKRIKCFNSKESVRVVLSLHPISSFTSNNKNSRFCCVQCSRRWDQKELSIRKLHQGSSRQSASRQAQTKKLKTQTRFCLLICRPLHTLILFYAFIFVKCSETHCMKSVLKCSCRSTM